MPCYQSYNYGEMNEGQVSLMNDAPLDVLCHWMLIFHGTLTRLECACMTYVRNAGLTAIFLLT